MAFSRVSEPCVKLLSRTITAMSFTVLVMYYAVVDSERMVRVVSCDRYRGVGEEGHCIQTSELCAFQRTDSFHDICNELSIHRLNNEILSQSDHSPTVSYTRNCLSELRGPSITFCRRFKSLDKRTSRTPDCRFSFGVICPERSSCPSRLLNLTS